MLNNRLVAEIQNIASDRRSGALVVGVADHIYRFYFEDGQLLLLDLGEDKEIVLAKTFLEFHKIDQAMFQLACSLYQNQATPIVDTLQKQRLISGDEAATIQRCMVEQVLINLFSQECQQLIFRAEGDPAIEPFDLDVGALKIRIESEMLLSMVQSRVQERDAVLSVINDFNRVYYRTHVDPARTSINEMEQHVLMMVDGAKNVRDIASSLRESTINIACYLKSLRDHGLVSEQPPVYEEEPVDEAPAPSPAAAAAPVTIPASGNMTPQPAAGSPAAMDDFQVYSNSTLRPVGDNRLLVWSVLLIVLVSIGFLAFVVVRAQQTSVAVDALSTQLDGAIVSHQWQEAEKHVSEAMDLAGQDIALSAKLEQVCADKRVQITQKLEQLEKLVANRELNKTELRLQSYPTVIPPDSLIWQPQLVQKLDSLRSAYNTARANVQQQLSDLQDKVGKLLNSNQADTALGLVESVKLSLLREPLQKRLDEWRQRRIEELSGLEGMSTNARLRLIEQILKSGPNEEQQRTLTGMRNDLLQQQESIKKRLANALDMATRGLVDQAEGLSQGLQLEGEDSEIGLALRRLRQQLVKSRRDIDSARTAVQKAIASDVRGNDLQRAQQSLKQVMADYPAIAESSEFEQLLNWCGQLQEAIDNMTLQEELIQIAGLLQQPNLDKTAQMVLQERQKNLQVLQQQAMEALESARELMRQRRAQAAKAQYQTVIDQLMWQRTEAAEIATKEIASADRLVAEQLADVERMHEAMAAGDIVAVRTLAEKLNLEQLPLFLSTTPAKATISVEGAVIGTTPMLIERLAADDRAETVYQFQLDGYQSVAVPAINARSGWQIAVNLKRVAVGKADCKQIISSRPAVIDGRVWVAGGRGVFAIDPQAEINRYWSGNNDAALAVQALDNPIYAPAARYGDHVYVTTRDNFVLEIDPKTSAVERGGISGQTNYAVVVFESDLIVDRRLYIIADLDNTIRAVETATGLPVWEQSCQSKVMSNPVIRDERLLVVLAEGTLLQFDPDNGNLLESTDIGDVVPAAWPTANGVGGYTMTGAWTFSDGRFQTSGLPAVVKRGGPGVFLSNENRIFLQQDDSSWKEIAPMRQRLTEAPMAWQGHAVLVHGKTATVMGPRPFTINSDQDMLAPCQLGELLVLSSADGIVRLYAP